MSEVSPDRGHWLMGNEEVWWESPTGGAPTFPSPIYRYGGPKDGMRLGTMLPGGQAHIGWDEHGNVLPGFQGGSDDPAQQDQ